MLIPLWKNYEEESEVNANHDLTVKSLRSNYSLCNNKDCAIYRMESIETLIVHGV